MLASAGEAGVAGLHDLVEDEGKLIPVVWRLSRSCIRILSMIFSTNLDGLALGGPIKDMIAYLP